jgi:site-specific DNA-methyltransferase (adenine-specific)
MIIKEERIGGQRLILGDCLRVMEGLGRFDAVVTDPPYGIDGGKGGDSKKFGKGNYSGCFPDTPKYIKDVCVPAVRLSVSMAHGAAVTTGIRCSHLYDPPVDQGCFYNPAAVTHGPWGFTNLNPIFYYGKDWRAGRGAWPSSRSLTERAEKNGHPCPKPIKAWCWLVEKTCPSNGTILDPFMGSGTTLVACQRMGRNGTGIELDPDYFQIACERVDEATRQGDMFVPTVKPKPIENEDMFS